MLGSLAFGVERTLVTGGELRMGSARFRFFGLGATKAAEHQGQGVYIQDGTHRGSELASDWVYFNDLLGFTAFLRHACDGLQDVELQELRDSMQ